MVQRLDRMPLPLFRLWLQLHRKVARRSEGGVRNRRSRRALIFALISGLALGVVEPAVNPRQQRPAFFGKPALDLGAGPPIPAPGANARDGW